MTVFGYLRPLFTFEWICYIARYYDNLKWDLLRKYLGATAGWLFFDAKSLQFFHSISSSYDQGKIQKSLQSGHLDWKRRKDEEYFPNVDDLEFLGYMILDHSFHRIFLKYMKIISMRLCKNISYLKIIISFRTYTGCLIV